MHSFKSSIALLGLFLAGPVFCETPATPCYEPSCIVAKRGTAVVTVADVMAKVNMLEPDQQGALLADSKQINKTIENLLILQQIANEADRAKADNDVVLQARLKQVQTEVLAVYQLDQIRAERVSGDYDRLAREYYLANESSMATPKQSTVRHLLIAAKPGEEAAARAKIDQLAKDLQGADQARFSTATLESSDDPSKASNGGIIQVTEGTTEMDPAFLLGALALNTVGEISPPVQSSFGYHLIQLIEVTPSEKIPFEQAKASIVNKLRQDARRRVVTDYRAEVMAKGELEVFPQNLERLIYGEDETAAK